MKNVMIQAHTEKTAYIEGHVDKKRCLPKTKRTMNSSFHCVFGAEEGELIAIVGC
jgi:hypothetical protein